MLLFFQINLTNVQTSPEGHRVEKGFMKVKVMAVGTIQKYTNNNNKAMQRLDCIVADTTTYR